MGQSRLLVAVVGNGRCFPVLSQLLLDTVLFSCDLGETLLKGFDVLVRWIVEDCFV